MNETYFIRRDCCSVCASRSHKTIYSCDYSEQSFGKFLLDYYAAGGGIEPAYLESAHYILDECNACGLIYQREVPNDALMAKLYEEWMDPRKNIEDHERSDDLNYFSGHAHDIMRMLSYFKRVPSTLKVLDFGMGLAKWALMAKAFGCDVYGTELSEVKKERARQYGVKVISLDEETGHQFDFINVDQVLEHVREPFDRLSTLRGFLKIGGIMKVCVPDGGDIKGRLKSMDWYAPRWTSRSLHPVHPLEHINCFNRQSLVRLASLAGLEVIGLPRQKMFPLLVRTNPLSSRSVRDIARTLRSEWRYNFDRPATCLLLRKTGRT